MRTSLNDIKETEQWLAGSLAPEEALFFEARLLTSPLLRLNVALQRKLNEILAHYHRKIVRARIEEIHHELFHNDSQALFQQSIHRLFKNTRL